MSNDNGRDVDSNGTLDFQLSRALKIVKYNPKKLFQKESQLSKSPVVKIISTFQLQSFLQNLFQKGLKLSKRIYFNFLSNLFQKFIYRSYIFIIFFVYFIANLSCIYQCT